MGKFNVSKEFKIGFFGVAMIAVLYWGINFLKGTDIFTSTKKYYAVYDQVNGLEASASVVIKGFKVGTVSNMSYDPKHSDNIILEFSIKSKYQIPDNSTARIFSEGIMSGKAVEIQLGNSQNYLNQGDTLYLTADKDFFEVAGSEFDFLKQKLNDVATTAVATLENLNKILEDNGQNLGRTVSNVASITENLNNVVESEKSSIKGIIDNLDALSLSLKQKSGQIDNIINNVETFSDSLSKSNIPTLISEITITMNSLNSTIEKINSGDGTVGKFVNDQQLYNSLVSASTNLSLLLADLKENPQRYVHFSLFGGGKKNK